MDLIARNYEETAEEILIGVDKESFEIKQEQNEINEITFNINLNGRNRISYDLVQYENYIMWNGQTYIIKQMTESASGMSLRKKVTAMHISIELKDGYQYDELTGKRSVSQLLTHVFKAGDLGFSWEVIDKDNQFITVEQENFGSDNYKKLIDEILDDYDAIMIADNKHLYFYPRGGYGNVVEDQIRYKYNTDDVSFDIDTLELKTQIKGFGKKDEDNDDKYYFGPITYTSPKAETWGIRIQDPVQDERYTVPGNMEKRLKKDLQDVPEISGTVTLKFQSDLHIYDYVPFIYEPLNINEYIQIVSLTEYPMQPSKPPNVTLSNTKKTMTSILASLVRKGVL
ncbi:hypothetical protein TEHN7126_2375 [Tetragenococcus halophilus subsp. halophilus]|uniref:phage tail protein n=1 Tax=Tetragenococcus halophilus TaxID=51669 RepID=UPI000CC0666D|nr:phage tail protein [Tetragenococcus halophilus]GBD74120.1 hypothetical protein TEHN7125_2280 [Tetragenococcus halophilus subsp. halophilus]GBD76676.1 hypothetical protein TEHN7126_2375 [Tetragenococcus halophilus subsp. halophilus]